MATTPRNEEIKLLIKKLIENGDKRSYNEIAADIELKDWTERHSGKTKEKINAVSPKP